MPKIRINDTEYEAKDGATILDVARANGIDIPYMCYHPGMDIVAVCRVCQVEVKGMPKLQTACSLPIRDGMEVFTESEQARKARAGTVEFWLVNHPLDCPICDKGGECPLQDVTYNIRGGGSRLRDPKVNRPKRKILGEHIVFDVERCIICWRCTRFTQDISGSEQLMLTNRGVKTEIDTPPGVTLTDPFSGNLADVCPVGALTTREFRFKSRPWEMTPVESTCTACSVGCSTTVWSKRGVIQRLTARENLEVNDYWLCDRGRFDTTFVNASGRLVRPTGPVSTAADKSYSWEEAALVLAGMAMGRDGANRVASWAVVAAPHATNEEYFALQRFARGVLNTEDLVLDTGVQGPELTPSRAEFLSGNHRLDAVRDLDTADVIVQVGQNLEASHPVYSLRIRKAVRGKGAKLYVGSTAPGGLDREASLRVGLNEGDEAAFLQGIHAGTGEDSFLRLKDALTSAARGVIILNAGPRNEALLAVALVLTKLNPSGLKLFVLDDGSNISGAWDMGFAAGYGPGRVAGLAGVAGSTAVAGSTGVAATQGLSDTTVAPPRGRAAVLAAVTGGQIEGLLLYNSGRPWAFSPDVLEAARAARRLVLFDIADGSLVEKAQLVLPTPTFAETDGTLTSPDGRVQLIRRAVPGPERLWHPGVFLARAERLAGGATRAGQPIDIFRDISREVAGYAQLNFGLLRASGLPTRKDMGRAPATVGGGSPE
ncbi:MAG: 2Fe-2S iron-sulfur cluster-binding protein [Candidatus Eisenbacteria bacterium]|nr:2Fe-2S iron-sulfur cluster-binding protein [Candidatus Eisenbacteria bacterium]